MPLILLGLILLLCILAYSIARYIKNGEIDRRTVRERYPHAFVRKDQNPENQPSGSGESGGSQDNASSEDDSGDETVHAEGYVDSDSLRGDLEYMFRNLREDLQEKAKERGFTIEKISEKISETISRINDSDSDRDKNSDEDDGTIIFPTDDVEAEKNKRNIH